MRAAVCHSALQLLALVGAGAAAGGAAWGGTGSPEVTALQPAGAQRGTNVTLTFRGARLGAAQGVTFYGDGLRVLELTNPDEQTVVAVCAVAADCPLGEHALRLRTSTGWSDIVTLFVSALPTVAEVEPNGDLAAAQRVAPDTTIGGTITKEDADWFAVELKAGERLSAEIEAMRLGRTMFDAAITIVDASRFELAVCDDSPLLAQDAFASIVAPKDGVYYVGVRESAYGGSDRSQYRLHVGGFPRPSVAWPPAAPPGSETSIAWRGEPRETPASAVALAADARGIVPVWAREGDRIAPSPNWLVASTLPVLDETASTGTVGASPVALHGVIAAPGEEDRWKVRVTKGEPLVLRVLAQRLGSPLDAVLVALDASGKELGTLDDTVGADPELRATPDADGEYELRVRDHRRRGGPTFTYRIELAPPAPAVSVGLERVDSQRPQFLQAIAVPRGACMAGLLRADRTDIAGPVTATFSSLPPGIVAEPVTVPADRPFVPVVFRAAADAPLGGGLVGVEATCNAERGGFRQAVPLVRGAPNDTVYYETAVRQLAVAVTEAAPFRVSLVAPKSPLAREGAKTLSISVARDEGFTGDVTVHVLWNPPGVSAPGAVTIPAAATEGAIPLNASGDAALGTHRIALLAHAPVGGGDVWLATEFVDLVVCPPYCAGTLPMAAAETGTTARVVCSLRDVKPFEGEATFTLLGLPPKTSAPPQRATAAATEIVFDVAIAADAPLGQHRGLQCAFALPVAGEVVEHRVAAEGILRIDAPAVAAAPASAPVAAPEASPPPPLSRLEQLRRAAKEAAARKGGGS